MSALMLAIISGGLVGLGATLIVWRLVPAEPHLRAALDRLDPIRGTRIDGFDSFKGSHQVDLQDCVGVWVQRHAPAFAWGRVPTRELAILHIPVHRYFGQKALLAAIGLLFPPLATVVFSLAGLQLPLIMPVGASVVLAVGLSFVPDLSARAEAAKAREEFLRGLGAYIDLVALERAGGSGSTQSLERAAEVGDSWVFRRIREELGRARWAGQPPWEGLIQLSDELGLAELSDLADIMRLSGEEGATVYQTLRARSASMRTAILSKEHAKANAAGERMSLPVSVLALIFLVILALPTVLRVMFPS